MKPIILIVACAMLWTGCARDHVGHEHASDSGAHEAHAAETRGPHGGRLLESGALALELAIFESAVPPELHAWLTRAGRPIPPAEYDLSIELHRLGGTIDRVSFTPAGEFLRSDIEVREPHSFDVKVVLTYDGQTHRWEYASYEGRTRIPRTSRRALASKLRSRAPASSRKRSRCTEPSRRIRRACAK
jgi:cobalt-zinc-cadmium efflux system membrane fusion protein